MDRIDDLMMFSFKKKKCELNIYIDCLNRFIYHHDKELLMLKWTEHYYYTYRNVDVNFKPLYFFVIVFTFWIFWSGFILILIAVFYLLFELLYTYHINIIILIIWIFFKTKILFIAIWWEKCLNLGWLKMIFSYFDL